VLKQVAVAVAVRERRRAGQVHERAVDMAAAAGEAVVPLRHESHALALQQRDLFDAVLIDDVAIRHLEGVRVAQIELGLARTPFAFGGFDRDAGALHAVADGADQALLLGRLADVIVLDVPAGCLETFVAFLPGALVRLVEHVELELGRHVGAVAEGLCALDLAAQDRARRMGQELAVMIDHVAEHQGGAVQPRDPAQGREVRPDREVAVAELPRRRRIAWDRLHLHVDGEQIVAGMHLVRRLLDEEAPAHALADQPALHVGEAHQHGVDRSRGDLLVQCVEVEIAGHGRQILLWGL
jgi:hypothetical protein